MQQEDCVDVLGMGLIVHLRRSNGFERDVVVACRLVNVSANPLKVCHKSPQWDPIVDKAHTIEARSMRIQTDPHAQNLTALDWYPG